MLTVSPGLEHGVLTLQMTDVLIVHVDVDEAPELAFVGVEMLAEIAVATDERLECLNGSAIHLDDIRLRGGRGWGIRIR